MARPPFVLTDEHIKKIELMSGWGLTLTQIAAVIGIAECTLIKKKNDDLRVSSALERGKAKAEAVIGKSLFERAADGDIAAIRWWEMTRAKRSAEAKIEHTGAQIITVAPTPDWRALIGPQLLPQPPDHAA